MKAAAGGHHGGRVVPLGEQHEGMVGAAPQQRTGDQRFQPGHDRLQEQADQILDKRGDVGQIARAGAEGLW